jgi:hypothetical protein
VPEYCTCGAQLPPDARFCHKCGKPQFEYPQPEPEPVPEPLAPAISKRLDDTEIGFHNRTAVRVSFLAALIAFLISGLPMPVLAALVWVVVVFLAAGFATVFLYSKRTGQSVNVRGGTRLGWMTGLFSFTASLIRLTIAILYFSELKAEASRQDPRFHDLAAMVGDRTLMIVVIVAGLVVSFVVFTLLPIVGGALCAKVLGKD